jgi:hypothetical protein
MASRKESEKPQIKGGSSKGGTPKRPVPEPITPGPIEPSDPIIATPITVLRRTFPALPVLIAISLYLMVAAVFTAFSQSPISANQYPLTSVAFWTERRVLTTDTFTSVARLSEGIAVVAPVASSTNLGPVSNAAAPFDDGAGSTKGGDPPTSQTEQTSNVQQSSLLDQFNEPIEYARIFSFPPPWTWLAFIAGLIGLGLSIRMFFTARRNIIAEILAQSRDRVAPLVNAVLDSDGPISDPAMAGDALNALTRRMFRFMTNTNTAAPLTFALEGGWGKGKSSAMRVLQTKLEAKNYPTVWFNAWHHQKEEHLFASLMEEVRANAVPGPARFAFLHPRNLMLRARLFLARFRTRPLRYALIALVAAFLFSIALKIGNMDGQFVESANWIGGFGAFGGVVLSLRLMRDLTAPFKANPAVLLNMSRMAFSPGRFQDRLSFRDQFAEAFGEVTRALGHRRLTIFIDDLDRCGQKQVVEMLEAVNFLVSSGDCYVVMGLARKPVEVAIGLQFDALAKATADSDDSKTEAQNRREFAEHYLEKMINLSIKIPAFDDGALKELMDRAEGGVIRRPLWTRLQPTLRLAAATLVTASAIWGGWQISQREDVAQMIACQTVLVDKNLSCKTITTPNEIPLIAAATGGSEAAIQSGAAPSTTSYIPPLIAIFAILLAIGAFIPRRSRKYLGTFDPEHETAGESVAFRNAIRACLPLLLSNSETNYPRALKRFVNLMRFMTANIPDNENDRMLVVVFLGALVEVSEYSLDPRNRTYSIHEIETSLQNLGAEFKGDDLQQAVNQAYSEFINLSAMIRFSGGARAR